MVQEALQLVQLVVLFELGDEHVCFPVACHARSLLIEMLRVELLEEEGNEGVAVFDVLLRCH